MPQLFHQVTTMENDGEQKTTPQPHNARPTERIEEECFYCDKLGRKQAQCRQKARDVETGTLRTRERQNTDDWPQCHRKILCKMCEYTGHSAKYCNVQQKKCLSIAPNPVQETDTRRDTKSERRYQRNIEKSSWNQPAHGRLWVWWPTGIQVQVSWQRFFELNTPRLPPNDKTCARRWTQHSTDDHNYRLPLTTRPPSAEKADSHAAKQTPDDWLTCGH